MSIPSTPSTSSTPSPSPSPVATGEGPGVGAIVGPVRYALAMPNYGALSRLRRQVATGLIQHEGIDDSAAMKQAVEIVASLHVDPPITGPQLASWLGANAAAWGSLRQRDRERKSARRNGSGPTVSISVAQPALIADPVVPPSPVATGEGLGVGADSSTSSTASTPPTADHWARFRLLLEQLPPAGAILPRDDVLCLFLGCSRRTANRLHRQAEANGYRVTAVEQDNALLGYHYLRLEDPAVADLRRAIAAAAATLADLTAQFQKLAPSTAMSTSSTASTSRSPQP